MPSGHVSSSFSSQVVEFDSGNALVNTINDTLGDLRELAYDTRFSE